VSEADFTVDPITQISFTSLAGRAQTKATQRTQRNERNSRKNCKLQPIQTELSSFQLNSLRFKIYKKINRPNFSTFFTCCAIHDANQL